MGHELAIGDRVVYLRPMYRCLIWGTITAMSHKTAGIKREDRNSYAFVDRRPFSEIILDTRGWTKPPEKEKRDLFGPGITDYL